ncbi:hypothetical protein MSIM_23980 [Mycobacterium simiae]|nr:hypothetical protein MSIM_23980 [Mycobacterium simiae]
MFMQSPLPWALWTGARTGLPHPVTDRASRGRAVPTAPVGQSDSMPSNAQLVAASADFLPAIGSGRPGGAGDCRQHKRIDDVPHEIGVDGLSAHSP